MCSLQTQGLFRSSYTHVFRHDNSKRSTDMKTDDRIRKRGDGATSSFVSQHAMLWESHAHSTATSSAPASRPRVDFRSLGGLSEKINANRLKFDQTGTSSTSSPSPSSTTVTPSSITPTAAASTSSSSSSAPSVKKIHRGRNNFGQLLQKFSSSEVSGSEKSDNESSPLSRSQSQLVPGAAPPRLNVLRQSAERGSASGSDGETQSSIRRTPERSQSLKVLGKGNVEDEKSSNGLSERQSTISPRVEGAGTKEKTSGYKSDFMAQRMSGQTATKHERGGSDSGDGGVDDSGVGRSKMSGGTESGSGGGSGSEAESGDRQSRYKRLRNQIVSDMNSSAKAANSGSSSSSNSSSTLAEKKDPSSRLEYSSAAAPSNILEPSSSHSAQNTPTENGLSSASNLESNSPSALALSKDSTTMLTVSDRQKKPVSSSSIVRRSPLRDDGKVLSRRSWHTDSTPSDLTTLSSSGTSTSASSSSLPPTTSLSSSSSTLSSSVTSIAKAESNNNSNDAYSSNLSTSTSTPCIASSLSSSSLSPSLATTSAATVSTETIPSTEAASTANANTNNTTTNIRRAFSFKDVSAEHSENSETRRGILKRATSLTKRDMGAGSPSSKMLDPQLAKILQQRRQIQGDVKEEDEDEEEEEEVGSGRDQSSTVVRRRSRALSAAEEIEQNLKYSKEKAAERGIDPEEDETFKRRSVADRIFFMQAKIEEVKQVSSSGSRSGVSSPRSRPRSGPITPTQQRSLDEALYLSTLSPRSPPPPTTLSSSSSPVGASRSPCSPSRTFSTLSAVSPSSSSSQSAPKSSTASNEVVEEEAMSSTVHNTISCSHNASKKISIRSTSLIDDNSKLRSQLNFDEESNDRSSSTSSSKQSKPSSTSSASVRVASERSENSAGVGVLETSSIPKLDLSDITGRSGDSTRKAENGSASAGRAVSGDQLMQKLSEIADATDAYQERRQRFQHRPKDDWRHRTQPVTFEEIQAADRLETVASFRALIRKETSTGLFKQIQLQNDSASTTSNSKQPLQHQQKASRGKGGADEFPQHLAPSTKHQRRSRKSRYNTLPVTAEELKAVPENTELGTESDWATYVETLRADSGIELASSDVDISAEYANSLRSLTLEMEVDESDPAAQSVSAKTGMFKAIDDKKNKSASGAKRYINRKKRERSQTMPITDEEVKTAAEEQQQATSGTNTTTTTTTTNGHTTTRPRLSMQRQPDVVNRSKSVDLPRHDDDGDDDDPENDQLTKLSLSEKVKLFSQPKQAEKAVTKSEAPVVRRRHRKQASRFNTQPVTTEEVEKAAASTRISPLAMSMVKPPDPEILKGLPLKDQRQLMAAHAEMCLSQNSSRSQSRAGSVGNLESSQNSSRRSSTSTDTTTLTDKDPSSHKGILKSDSGKDLAHEIHGILKPSEHTTTTTTTTTSSSSSTNSSSSSSKSILKIKPEDSNVRPDANTTSDEEEHRSILKTTSSGSPDDNNDRDLSGQRSRSNSQPSGILKHDDINTASSLSSSNSNSNSSSRPTRGILKAASQEKVDDASGSGTAVIKSALRRGSSDIDDVTSAPSSIYSSSSSTLKSALKHNNNIISSPHESEKDGDSSVVGLVAKESSGKGVGHSNSSIGDSVLESSRRVADHAKSSDVGGSNSSKADGVDVSCVDGNSVVVKESVSEGLTQASKDRNVNNANSVVGDGDDASDYNDEEQSEKMQEPEMEESGSSSGELLEDTPRSRIKKKRFADRMARNSRFKSQPTDLTSSTAVTKPSTPLEDSAETTETGEVTTTVKKKYKYEGRHKTQPITDDEMRDAEANTPIKNNMDGGSLTPGGSIADRLNQLKTSGNEEWKKRVDKKDELVTPAELVKKREKKAESERPKSIADRLNQIEVSKMSWKGRVEESDAKMFTVAGKIGNSPGTPPGSPLLGRRKPNTTNTPEIPACQPTPILKSSEPPPASCSPIKDSITKIPLPKDIVKDTNVNTDAATKITSSVKKADSFRTKVKVDEDALPTQEIRVEVPKVGDDFDEFFHTKSLDEINKERVEVDIDDFDNITVDPQQILTNVRKARPTRNTKSSSRNPLKAMAQTIELKQEYTQQSHGVADREFKRVKKENLAKDAGFAQAALAGLASKENFKSVELRRSDSNSLAHGQRLDPFNDVMLLQVKGRRSVQTRLVEPHTRSLNSGDCFILVTQEKVVQWEGQFANVIEKAKASEIAQIIQAKKDLGCKKASDVHMVSQARDQYGPGKILWSTLEGERQCQDCGPDTEDEVFESSMVRSNMVFRLEGNALIPYEDYWGVILKHDMLKRNEVLVFDFGTEFYLWQGKGVAMEQRKLSLRLAKQLYDKGYDYSQAPINPVCPLRSPEAGGLSVKAEKRPNWAIFGKVNQNMETVLFREKFCDWPDSSRLIQCKGHDGETSNKELQKLKAYDAKKMIPISRVPVTLKLEGADVGRGVKWSEDMQGFIKEQDIITLEVTAWHVLEYEHFKLPVTSHGQFHDGDTYVVRWQYMIANANLRSLKKGSASSHNSLTGRERCAYFFWQGNQSTINEKGASALMTVELDEERGPQVRVLEGKEPPCFLNLFGGKMILHIGKREEPDTNTQGPWRLYCLRGDYDNEMYLLEVPVYLDHLRSRSSMVLLNVDTGRTYIWHGVRSPSHIRKLCKKAVDNIQDNIPLELGMKAGVKMDVKEVEEGEEGVEIWGALGKKNRDKYHSLIMNPVPTCTKTLRLYHMSSVNMVFDVHEQLSPCRTSEFTSAFPFLQLDLYTAIQPALFLLDCHHSVYLWQGWWPTASKDHQNVHTGSATARFTMDRRLAMETALSYCQEKNPSDPPKAYLVCAGVEPLAFTTLFPYWIVNDAIRDLAIEDGKSPGYTEDVSEVLHRVTQTRYTLTELQERPLPEGVDPLKLETFLHDKDFEECLEMTREEFYTQPAWKQRQLKQLVGLF